MAVSGERPHPIRRIAALIVRGPDARHILDDLDELRSRDRAAGMAPPRVWFRYLFGVLASATSVTVGRLRGLTVFRVSWLDVRLGIRMLFKYPGLTGVGGLALAFAVWVGAVSFEVVAQMLRPELPLDEGERIVSILNGDPERGELSAPVMADYTDWNASLTSFEDLGAFRDASRNLTPPDRATEPLIAAEITPAGFRAARVSPLMGRTLIDSDAAAGAAPVLVVGYEVWQTRFGGDPDAVGSSVGLGRESATVVGVMPEGFGFPKAHQAWIPLRDRGEVGDTVDDRRVLVFGRLARGVTVETAQQELVATTLGRAATLDEGRRELRPRIVPYARAVAPLPDIGAMGLWAANVFVGMLFVLICGSVSLLVWARTANRSRELAIRSALGASRGRIATQLYVEALVLGSAAALIGLVAADAGVGWYTAMMEADSGPLPFWTRGGVRASTGLYVASLTVAGALLVGVVPALRVTGRRVDAQVRRSSSESLRLRGLWGKVIVAQIAVTVAFPATAFFFQRFVSNMRDFDVGLDGAYVATRLTTETSEDADDPADRVAATYPILRERLLADPSVLGVTFGESLPGDIHPRLRFEVETTGSSIGVSRRIGVAGVAVDFFEVFGAEIVAGRGFGTADLDGESRVLVVNEEFVSDVLGDRSAVGRRIRFEDRSGRASGPWFEIVGVVDGPNMIGGDDLEVAAAPGLYRPVSLESASPLFVAVRHTGDVGALAAKLRSVAVSIDPELQAREVRSLDEISESLWRESEFLYQLLTGISLVALTLSLVGIYSVMSLSVTKRTREIGVRVALGSERGSIIATIFAEPLRHVAAGIVIGAMSVALVTAGLTQGVTPAEIAGVGLYAACMLGVCLVACVVPTRKALAVEPTEALRAEG